MFLKTLSMFVVDEFISNELARLVDFAESHPFSMDDILDMYNGQKPPPGDTAGYSVFLPNGFKIVLSIENQKQKLRHISISVYDDLPTSNDVENIMKLTGFKCDNVHTYVEDGGDIKAINLIEVIK